MRVLPSFSGAFICFLLSLLLTLSFCYGDDKTVHVFGIGECAYCSQYNVKSSHAFSGLHVTIDCKSENGHFKTKGFGVLDEEGKFKVSLPKEMVKDGELEEECYAQLHSASGTPCPAHDGLQSSKIISSNSKVDGKQNFGLVGKLKFSPITCTSKFFWSNTAFHRSRSFEFIYPPSNFPYPQTLPKPYLRELRCSLFHYCHFPATMLAVDSNTDGAIVPLNAANGSLVSSLEEHRRPEVYPLHHGFKPPIARLSVSWARGNTLRVSVLCPPSGDDSGDDEFGGRVMEVRLGHGDAEIGDSQWRRIAYGSVSPFALLQSRRNSVTNLSKLSMSASPYHVEWWEYVMEYSKDINAVLGNPKPPSGPLIEDPKTVLKTVEEPTCLKAAWELMEIFFADKQSQPWLPERLVDWLSNYDSLLSSAQSTIYSKLVSFQEELVSLQAVEDDPRYWEMMSLALAVGWLEVVVKMLRLHGSYQPDQLGNRETENGLVEAVAVLISKLPRMRPELEEGKLGQCFKVKSDFIKEWEKWRAQITKLDCSAFWIQCHHHQTREGLKNMLHLMLGNNSSLCAATCHWIELYISHLLYIRPFTTGLESLYSLAQKCMLMKPAPCTHRLIKLLIGILGENTEVVLAECSRAFGPWMVSHAIELLTAGNDQAEILLHEERNELGGISIAELHRLIYAQVLSAHPLTWQIAPIYLTSCLKQGIGLLDILLLKQPVQHNEMLLKNIELCRLYELDTVCSNIMKIAGVYHWKHGRKGAGVFWLQQARDEVRLNRISQHLFSSVGKSISDESFKQWEGLIELLSSESKIAGGLEFMHKYRDFKKSLKQVHREKTTNAPRQAVESLISLMKNPSTPQRFWLPLLYDSLELLNWQERPLLNVSQTYLLLNKLQELSMARLRPEFVEVDLPTQALCSVRLALATNLGRAILEE